MKIADNSTKHRGPHYPWLIETEKMSLKASPFKQEISAHKK
jgi:hypothetical protein